MDVLLNSLWQIFLVVNAFGWGYVVGKQAGKNQQKAAPPPATFTTREKKNG